MNTSLRSCAFFGHRKIQIDDNLIKELKQKITTLITEENYSHFYFGGFGAFDELCWKIVSQLRHTYPHIQRIYCVPDKNLLRPSKRPLWLNNENYEDIVYLELDFDWWYQRIYYRNIAIINLCDYIIFYITHKENSGAYKALTYAKKHKKNLEIITTKKGGW